MLGLASATNTYLPLILSAGVTLFAAFSVPLLLVYLANRQRRKERQEDWDRQDALAKRAEDQNAKLRAEVGVVKTLVNGEKTAAMQRALEDLRRQRLTLVRNIELTERVGEDASGARVELAALDLRIAEIEAELVQRHRYFDLAQKQKQMDDDSNFEEDAAL